MKLNIDQAAVVGHLQALEANKAIKMLINRLLTSHKILWAAVMSTRRDLQKSAFTPLEYKDSEQGMGEPVKLAVKMLRSRQSPSCPSSPHPQSRLCHHCCHASSCDCSSRWSVGSTEARGPCLEPYGSDGTPRAARQTFEKEQIMNCGSQTDEETISSSTFRTSGFISTQVLIYLFKLIEQNIFGGFVSYWRIVLED